MSQSPGSPAQDAASSKTEQRADTARDRAHRRLRFRRHRRRAYIRSAYSLPSLATLGNAVCGFGAMYLCALASGAAGEDPLTRKLATHPFTVAAYLIFAAMFFDAIDGRLARFTRHTTDFGGQLDSLADVISFGAAPAFLALMVFKHDVGRSLPPGLTRLVWAIGALFMSCAAIRLARFNVSNEHGEQHHFSFLGLPSPAAGGVVASLVLLQQSLKIEALEMVGTRWGTILQAAATTCVWMLAPVVLLCGLLMVSHIRYPHLVNRYLRGRRPLGQLPLALAVVLMLVVWHEGALAIGHLIYLLWGLGLWAFWRMGTKRSTRINQ